MKIIIADEIGYCYGVRDAVNATIDASSSKEDNIYTYGSIIHNRQTIEKLENEHHVQTVNSLEEVDKNGTIVIRTHGIDPQEEAKLRENSKNVIDATCPFVKKTHRKAKEFSDKGYFLVVLGKKNHPEVKGIEGFAGKRYAIVEHEEDLEQVPRKNKLAVVFQSTVAFSDFEWAITELARKSYDFTVLKTICGVTITRQQKTKDVAKEVDIMIIIGGKNSSNTIKLVDLSSHYTKSYHIEDPADLDSVDFTGVNSVGIGSGTSTPSDLVDQIISRLEEISTEKTACHQSGVK